MNDVQMETWGLCDGVWWIIEIVIPHTLNKEF